MVKNNQCKVCQNKMKLVIPFGKMPIANGFINKPDQEEFFYNMEVYFCPSCFMVQLGETVSPEMMFNQDYHFISSTSNFMIRHFKDMAKQIIKDLSEKKSPFVVELGCNDGVMLKYIAFEGISHLGIEPSGNVAQLARKEGVEVSEEFFNARTAKNIKESKGQADIISGANVMCHIEDINSVFEGINILLKEDGVFFFEDPYLLDIAKKNSFDQMYDEHVYYFSGLSISELAKRHNLCLVDMAAQDVHGGSMRYYIKRKGNLSDKAKKFIDEERKIKLDKTEGYQDFKERVNKICSDLKNTLLNIKKTNNKIIGYGATSKSTTLLNYADIGTDIIDYISDTTPTKINKFSPGMHIPIKPYSQFAEDKPPYALLLAWNHKKEIFAKEDKYRKEGGKFITYFPRVKVE